MEASRMRELAFPTTVSRVMGATFIVVALVGAFGCGDVHDGGANDGGPAAGRGGSGGRGGRGGNGGASGAPAIEPLPAKTAGKGCSEDTDCGSGMCLTSLPGAFGGGTME